MADEPWFDPEEDARNFDRRELEEAVRRLSEAADEAFAGSRGGRAATPQDAGTARESPEELLANVLEGLTSSIADLQDEIAGLSESLSKLERVGGRAAAREPSEDENRRAYQNRRAGGGQFAEYMPDVDYTAPMGGGTGGLDDVLGELFGDELGKVVGRKLGPIIESKLGGGAGRLAGELLGSGEAGGILSQIGGGGGGRAATPPPAGGGAAGAGGASAAAGGMSVAGAAAIALAIDQLASKLISDQGQKVRGNIEGLTDAYKSAISGDAEGLAKGGSEAVAGTLEGFGISGKVMAENVRNATALATAFKDLIDTTLEVADAQHAHNMRLAENSAAIAAVEAEADIRTTFREIDLGRKTAGSTDDLSDSIQDLRDDTKDVVALIDNVKNTVLARLVDVADLSLKQLNLMARVANELLPILSPMSWFFKRFEEDVHPDAFKILDDIRKEEAEARRRGDEWFRRADFGRQKDDERF